MYDQQNVFAKILRRELPCRVVYEDDEVLAFYDAFPKAPIHVLVIPKGQFISFDDFISASPVGVASFFSKVAHVTDLLGVKKAGYRLVTNHGEDGGQIVKHFHVHILAGKQMSDVA
ncbi:histidine triad nucleotide-binding protein [Neorickettsia sp. 179522]|uniref:histidine triad nucleotide-binding protein n=1 Tax=Neorickettsia sp. 179522 TaxID=1714371 RepID=UPI00079AC1C9|nr:histidine triad nucleotide-binding protein [Neorickettsia sp. 179522]KYH12494.1 histidine triad nucleotide-binding protein [Neorickettsia sp. 179522]